MPTINQLVRKPRTKVTSKSKSPAMQRVVNNLKTKKKLRHLSVAYA